VCSSDLFATLDTKTRRLELNINKLVLLSDTVGFIRKLPHTLVESFKSTLDEVLQADFLLHVIDISHPGFEEQMVVVRDTLKEIGVGHDNIIEVFNKIDALEDPSFLREMREKYPDAVFISAIRGLNISLLKEMIGQQVAREYSERQISVHVSNYKLITWLYEHTEVIDKRYVDEEVELTFRVRKNEIKQIDALINSSQTHHNDIADL
jgi:GTP-binding protein HflX